MNDYSKMLPHIEGHDYETHFWNALRGKAGHKEFLSKGVESITGAFTLTPKGQEKYMAAIQQESLFRNLATTMQAYGHEYRIKTAQTEDVSAWVPEGGSVTVTDNSPCGSVFTVSLPKNCIDTPEDTNNKTDDNADATDNDSTTPSELKSNSRFTILVADDSRDLCTFIADSLSTEYNVLTAADGEEALQMLRKNTVNLVVSDIMMPKIDGLELCKRIKTDIKWSHIPVILLTAKSADMSIVEGLQQGADDYITKPFNIEHLRLRVQKFIDWTATSHRTFRQKIEVAPSEITITPLDEKFVEQAIAIVEKHIADTEYSVEQLGHDLGMSRTNLYKKLVTITGKGPHDFIRTIRLKRAYQLLEKSQMNISEIAYHVGYSSPKRFSENFKNEYGMTPSEFVKNIKKD